MGSVSRIVRNNPPEIQSFSVPVGARPTDKCFFVEIEDEGYARFSVGSILIFLECGFIGCGVYGIEYPDGGLLIALLVEVKVGVVRLDSFHPEAQSGEFALSELNIAGKLLEFYPRVDAPGRWVWWDDSLQVADGDGYPIINEPTSSHGFRKSKAIRRVAG
jgi:hypothetical protein